MESCKQRLGALSVFVLAVWCSDEARAGNILPGNTWIGPVAVVICENPNPGQLLTDAQKSKLHGRGCVFDAKSPDNQLLSPALAIKVRSALAVWKQNFDSKISLVEADVRPSGEPYIRISASGGKCSSLGQGMSTVDTIHAIELSDNCSVYNVVHELMHRVGVVHEQKRSDRATYLGVTFTSAATKTERRQFDIEGKPTGDYDFHSVMHYPLHGTYFSTNLTAAGEDKLKAEGITNPSDKVNGVGQRTHLSDGDKAAISELYRAPAL